MDAIETALFKSSGGERPLKNRHNLLVKFSSNVTVVTAIGSCCISNRSPSFQPASPVAITATKQAPALHQKNIVCINIVFIVEGCSAMTTQGVFFCS